MRHLHTATHPDIEKLSNHSILQRKAARAIALEGEEILLLYTERYHDYTLPGGGIDEQEDVIQAMVRELREETGANNIQMIQPYGLYEEFRPWYREGADVIHMISYCYTCKVDRQLGQTRFEEYEIKNGMKPVWMNIHQAIAHNEQTMAHSQQKGMSIDRETFLLRLIAKELL
ncbi:NUDIX domain-containing protein [Vibrio cincinnatiensis]|jgi:ADP-ribose pyrophosphatase YjhB (NUDIX family)|uniref:NUDIX domain-containing protein n=1 Tax=Vibrio cincinnatiensis DSM 19608 TaxID=1123491 RepID=A0A1T4LJ67_VIBCI|nr:NUDIX hydrolase [Vibrio cincinnatiensis]MCG3722992.1 NUDIX domain-containing protein [Vibrio cincinnatiensis]MCG3726241.1 NUDIX domain-containing protein [Vibrio cincinnatiensis]MCG3767671.1 NUDIX domain-containing protein [Vibrio cincinnatiensis]SJZ54681.1 NUDIX domain-containing protein [Vibrio cincinnatiensis DSM 19608]SUP06005.1 MutT/nudix family protein [Vibrio cincinnatiensis]